MTEQQINELKQILEHSDLGKNSNSQELDEKILLAAQKHTANIKLKSAPSNFRKNIFTPSFAAAVFSVMFTVFLFLGLGKMLSVDHIDIPAPLASDSQELDVGETSNPLILSTPDISRPEKPSVEPTALARNRDSILQELPLPSVDKLLGDMDFDIDADRSLVKDTLSIAMHDIGKFIQVGELDDARQRYQRLRQSCSMCTLPESLESLALINNGLPDRS